MRFAPGRLEALIDGGDGLNARIFEAAVGRFVPARALGGFEPVINAADEGADQRGMSLCGCFGLRRAENKRHVAMNAFGFKHAGRFAALPGCCDLDENAFAGNAHGFVKSDDATRFGNRCVGVKTQACVDFGRDASGNVFENGCAKPSEYTINSFLSRLVDTAGGFKNVTVLAARSRLQNQGRIGGGFGGFELRDGINVARIGNHDRHGFQLFEFTCLLHRCALFFEKKSEFG